MQKYILEKLYQDPKMLELLKENSEWIKYLNRDPRKYEEFVAVMKEKYRLRKTDKINDVIDNIDLISNLFSAIK